MADEQPIIVIKKSGGHGGHHGGAWKVAYADFVTAMMALFIVLWLLSSTTKQTQEEIAGYFNDPKGTATKKGSEGKPVPHEVKEKKDDMAALKKDLQKAIENINLLDNLKKQIEMTVTDEGLRIELIEDVKGTFFQSGSAQATPALVELLGVLAGELKKLPNSISIEGHTDAQPYSSKTNYGNWELSTDRANVARREMQDHGVRLNQVSQVRGFADQRLHIPLKPFDAANRRVSLVVQNLPRVERPKELSKEVPKEAVATTRPEPSQANEQKPMPNAASQMSAKPTMSLMDRAKGMFGHTSVATSTPPEGNRSE